MYRFVIAFLAAFGAASSSFAAPAYVGSDSATIAATHEVLVHSFAGVENPDAYSSSPGISPEVLTYLGGGATKEGKGAGFTPGTGVENPDAYASSLAISPEARGGATREGFTPGTGVENPDTYASLLSISPEARGGATKERKGTGFTPGTGVENPDAYASSLAIIPEVRAYLGGETAAAAAAGQ
jgi:hypothetical protein